MPDCDYCKESFGDEDTYLQHLKSEHKGELSRIDQRRVSGGDSDDSGGLPVGPIVIGLSIVIGLGMMGAVIFVSGGGDGEPDAYGTAHDHGTIEMSVMGEAVDFSQDRYQLRADRFHFEGGNGDVWHAHATGVTLEWAMSTLGIELTENSVTYQGTTYSDDDPNTNVTVAVNGESVDPGSYVLQGAPDTSPQDGDQVQIIVEETR